MTTPICSAFRATFLPAPQPFDRRPGHVAPTADAPATQRHPAQRPPIQPFAIVRDVRFPAPGHVYEAVMAIVDTYRRLTQHTLDLPTALRLYDRIRADRVGLADPDSPRPIPAELAPVADFMARNGYDRDACYLAIRHIESEGTARGACSIDGEDVAAIEAILATIDGEAGR